MIGGRRGGSLLGEMAETFAIGLGGGEADEAARSFEATWREWMAVVFPELTVFGEHHEWFWERVWEIGAGVRPEPIVAIWGRGGAKSSSAERAAIALGAMKRRRYALYVSGTQEQADRHVESIAALLESARMESVYPSMARRAVNRYGSSVGWRRSRLTTESGFVIDAVGLKTGTRGVKFEDQRPDLMIVDDVDEPDDSAAMTARKIHTLTHTLLPAGSPDLAVVAIQNVVIPDGVFGRMVEGAERKATYLADRRVSGPIPAVWDLEVVEREGGRVEIVGGEASWEGQPLSLCQRQIDDWGYEAFMAESQHVTRVRGAKHFPGAWWADGRARYKTGDRALLASSQGRWMFWDTAETGEEDARKKKRARWSDGDADAAYTAYVVIDVVPYENAYAAIVRWVWRDRVSADAELLETIEREARRWNTDGKLMGVVVEYASSGKFAVNMLRGSAPEWLRGIIRRFPATVSKDRRNLSAAIPCRMGRVWLPEMGDEGAPWLVMFWDELTAVPNAVYRDMTDAFSMGLIYLHNYLDVAGE